jgi:hypothetical protein
VPEVEDDRAQGVGTELDVQLGLHGFSRRGLGPGDEEPTARRCHGDAATCGTWLGGSGRRGALEGDAVEDTGPEARVALRHEQGIADVAYSVAPGLRRNVAVLRPVEGRHATLPQPCFELRHEERIAHVHLPRTVHIAADPLDEGHERRGKSLRSGDHAPVRGRVGLTDGCAADESFGVDRGSVGQEGLEARGTAGAVAQPELAHRQEGICRRIP